MPIYMNYNKIAGDVTADGHAKWIELNSFQFGVGRGIASPTGASADRESSAASFSEILVAKASDVASPKLFNEALQGEGRTGPDRLLQDRQREPGSLHDLHPDQLHDQ